MRNILILTIVLTVISADSFSQKKKDKPTKKEIEKAQKEFQKRVSEESGGELIAIEPKLVDAFIEAIKNSDMDKLYDMVDPDVKQIQKKEDMTKIFGLYTKYFGRILSYEQTTFGMRTRGSFGQYATVGYDVVFEKYKGKGMGAFKVYNVDTVKMSSFNLALADYTIVAAFDSIAKPTIEAINAKDKKEVYRLTSSRFKEYNSIADFEERINKVTDLDLNDLKMYRHQFGLKEGSELLTIYYELKDNAGHLQLTFVKLADKFELEGLNYMPKK
jgi:hypothetical protein